MTLASIPDVADVDVLGDAGKPTLDLLIEVPHGADRLAHYDALRARLRGPLPADLHEFFLVNTDVGAWQVGRRVAERVAAARPDWRVMAIRCLIPRTFIDCNRIEDATDDLASGGLTASVPAYVTDAGDRALLLDLHRRYAALVARALESMGQSGFALLPHTYGPRTVGIDKVDETIVEKLRWAYEPERAASWPLRPEVDLITRTEDGTLHAPEGVVESVRAAYTALGLQVAENKTYHMHPATLAHRWATRYPARVFCLEIRRDLLVPDWTWNRERDVSPAAADRFAAPLAGVILAR